MPAAPKLVYVVLKWHWRVTRDADEVNADDKRSDVRPSPHNPDVYELVAYQRLPDERGLPVRAFRDHARAAAFRREQEQARRESTNPFRYGANMEARTSLDLGRLRDWLLDAGLEPPGPQWEENPEKILASWQAWWANHCHNLTEEKLVLIACAIDNGLAGKWFGGGAVMPPEAGWLEEQLARVQEWTVEQRALARMNLMFAGAGKHPSQGGERDLQRMEGKWRKWWDKKRARMTEHQRAHVWAAMDKVRFFEVVELEEPTA